MIHRSSAITNFLRPWGQHEQIGLAHVLMLKHGRNSEMGFKPKTPSSETLGGPSVICSIVLLTDSLREQKKQLTTKIKLLGDGARERQRKKEKSEREREGQRKDEKNRERLKR